MVIEVINFSFHVTVVPDIKETLFKLNTTSELKYLLGLPLDLL